MSGAGKTTLSRQLSKELKIPLIAKDDMKVILFDALGWKDRDWSMKVGSACYKIMDYVACQQLSAGSSTIMESTFNPKLDNPKIQRWQEEYDFQLIQVYCHTDPKIARQRVDDRLDTEVANHPSHGEGFDALKNLDDRLRDNLDRPLDLESQIIKVDTADFLTVDPKKIAEEIQSYLKP